MTSLRNPVTGHEVRTDGLAGEFWAAAGYRPVVQDEPKPQRKRAAKKAAAKSDEK